MEHIRKLEGKGLGIVTISDAGEGKGIKEGRQEGIKVAKEGIARNMLEDDVSVERIAKYVELSVERVEELKKKMMKDEQSIDKYAKLLYNKLAKLSPEQVKELRKSLKQPKSKFGKQK